MRWPAPSRSGPCSWPKTKSTRSAIRRATHLMTTSTAASWSSTARLDGVTDDWVKSLTVQKVAGGGRPAKLGPADFAALFTGDLCCQGGACLGCCGDAGEILLPMTGEWALVRPVRLDLE